MPTIVQFRRGTTAQNNSFTGAVGELSIDLDLDVIRVHDGVTLGGFPLVGINAAQSLTNKSYAGSTVSVTGNITGGNISTAGQFVTGVLSATGNITGGNVLTAGLISATGNITGGNILGGANVNAITHTGTTVSVSANITGGNLVTAGLISATGNITGAFFLGNGSQLTGIDATSIQNGTSNVRVVSSGGNITASVAGVSNVVVLATTGQFVTGLISATGNISGGNISGTSIVGTLQTAAQPNITSVGTLSSLIVTANVTGGNLLTAGLISATGNISGGNISGTHFGSGAALSSITGANVTGTVASATSAGSATTAGTVTTAAQPNITSVGTLSGLTVTGTITGSVSGSAATATTAGSVTGQANSATITATSTNTANQIVQRDGSGNFSAGVVTATATNARYADLAELYTADADYAPGTVVSFGGNNEVTLSTEAGTTRVAGVVSSNPAYLMNSTCPGEFVAAIALQGRVPCKVVGPVRKGDLMVSANNGHAQVDNTARAGSIIGKAIENFDGDLGTIEIAVGRD